LLEIECRSKASLQATNQERWQETDSFREFASVERGELMTEGKALFFQAPGAGRQKDRRWPAAILSGRRREWNHDDGPPRRSLIKGIVRDDQNRSATVLFRTRTRSQVRPV